MFHRVGRIFLGVLLGGSLSVLPAASHKKTVDVRAKSQRRVQTKNPAKNSGGAAKASAKNKSKIQGKTRAKAIPGRRGVQKQVLRLRPQPSRPSSPQVVAPQRLVLQSASVLVADQATGRVLVDKGSERVLPIASITKLMTAMVVLDARQDLREPIEILSEDTDQLRHSRSRLPVGSRLSRGEALTLALMASENRAARALGRTFPGGVSALVAAMNAKAQALNLAHTRFEDPAGLSSGNVSSAQDLANLVVAAQKYREIRESTTRSEAEIHSGRRNLQFVNTNRLVRAHDWQIGLSKTGFIDEAGRCLVMQAQVAHRAVVIVLLDSVGTATRFADALRIRRWLERPRDSRP